MTWSGRSDAMLWWTIQNLAVAAVLAGAAWALCRSGRIGPVGRHALWLVVLIKLVTPPLVSWPWAVGGPRWQESLTLTDAPDATPARAANPVVNPTTANGVELEPPVAD